MCAKMTRERAEEFGAAWNSRDADLVTSFFAENGVYHASVGPEALGKSHIGKDNIRRGVQTFFDRYPDGKFENLKVVVAGDIGTFEWDFVCTNVQNTGKTVFSAVFGYLPIGVISSIALPTLPKALAGLFNVKSANALRAELRAHRPSAPSQLTSGRPSSSWHCRDAP